MLQKKREAEGPPKLTAVVPGSGAKKAPSFIAWK
jgi:hypothetical protein